MPENNLLVYSSGATAPPLRKTSELFSENTGVTFRFITGKAEDLFMKITETKTGDLLQCGAEYLLDEAARKGIIDNTSRRSVGYRRAVILVPPNNPQGVHSLADLTRKNMKVGISISGCLLGLWDDICSKAKITDLILPNITNRADGCGDIMSLIHKRTVDAIFGWNTFGTTWPKTSEVIELPPEYQVFRSTGIAIISNSQKKSLAKKFLEYLVAGPGKKIYEESGWIH
ncbi:MAG: substrate-binding domain-containing protein [Candidatus Hodarchaeota archaeon]